MRSLLLSLSLLLSTQIIAAPSHHELAEALGTISDANNMTDGSRSFLVCLETVGDFSPADDDQWLETRMVKTATVFVTIQDGDFTSTRRFMYGLTTGPFWNLESLNLLGVELLEDTAGVACSATAISHQF